MPIKMDNLPRFLTALAHVESNDGQNDYPRFEAAYAPKDQQWTVQGRIIVGTGKAFSEIARARWQRWGMASACSYSRWQILYHTAADLGFDGAPQDLWTHPEIARWYVESFVRRQLAKGVLTVEQLADAYNSGNAFDQIVPQGYIDKVVVAWKALDEGGLG